MKILCESGALLERGEGLRFEVERADQRLAAFAIRYEGRVYAYLNRCAHIGVELDWQPGRFFDVDGATLICSTHGATYTPQNGECVAGPCRGKSLTPLSVREAEGFIYLMD